VIGLAMLARASDWLRHVRRRRVLSHDLAWGRRGEDLAHRYLRRRKFTIVARNYRLATGEAEVDIIAWDRETLVFVEVKSRTTGEYGAPDRAIGSDKQRHILRVAREYTRKTGTPWERVRFDVVTVIFGPPLAIEHIRDAFAAS
jgi:putative endonuclease